jgi:hypothetical protein
LELRRTAGNWRYWFAVLFSAYIAYGIEDYAAREFAPFFWLALHLAVLGVATLPTTSAIVAPRAVTTFMVSRPVGRRDAYRGRVAAHALLCIAMVAGFLVASLSIADSYETTRTSMRYTQIWKAKQADGSLSFASKDSEACYETWERAFDRAPRECQRPAFNLAERLEENPDLVLLPATPEQQECLDWRQAQAERVAGCHGLAMLATTQRPAPALVIALQWFGCLLFWSVAALAWRPALRTTRRGLVGVAAIGLAATYVLETLKWNQILISPWQAASLPLALAGIAYVLGLRAWATGDLLATGPGARLGWRRLGWAAGIAGLLALTLLLVLVMIVVMREPLPG